MIASVMDLRYRTKKVLRALEAGEEIVLTHRDIEKGKIITLAQNFRFHFLSLHLPPLECGAVKQNMLKRWSQGCASHNHVNRYRAKLSVYQMP
jgi:antitoxin (DNA-binding transcriptional repressor) of toxin-antitoxin stability system